MGVHGLNIDARNLKAYPATLKLWHQLQAYPQEIIPLMDQAVKDVMVELATKEMQEMRRALLLAPPFAREMAAQCPRAIIGSRD